ncbi:MAG: RusA family crossover junction endodeoxyribonuclease [Thermomicrobiales bacterium]
MKSPVSLTLTLPLPPSVNNQYVTVGKRRVLSKPAQAFKRDVTKLLSGMRERGELDPMVEKAFGASLIGAYFTFYFETPMRRDLDGGLKIALDALAKGIGFDDRSVVDMHLTKQIDPLHPRLEVELETIVDWAFDKEYVYLGEPASDGEDPIE